MAVPRQSIRALFGGTVALAALATASALAGHAPAASLPAGGCAATTHLDAQWGTGTNGGQLVTVTVTTTSAATTTSWAVTWALGIGQRITSAWNAAVSAVAGTVTATNTAHNGTLAPGASTTFGMQLAGIAPAPALRCDTTAGGD